MKVNRPIPVNPSSEDGIVVTVKVSAVSIQQCGNGVFEISFRGRPLSDADAERLDELFPHCRKEIVRLLHTEAILNNIH